MLLPLDRTLILKINIPLRHLRLVRIASMRTRSTRKRIRPAPLVFLSSIPGEDAKEVVTGSSWGSSAAPVLGARDGEENAAEENDYGDEYECENDEGVFGVVDVCSGHFLVWGRGRVDERGEREGGRERKEIWENKGCFLLEEGRLDLSCHVERDKQAL